MTIPEAAIEAAREALDRIVPNSDGVLWDVDVVVDQRTGMTQPQPVTLTHAARAAVEASLPVIREALAQEIEAGSYDPVLYRVAKALVADAARIVRGGTP